MKYIIIFTLLCISCGRVPDTITERYRFGIFASDNGQMFHGKDIEETFEFTIQSFSEIYHMPEFITYQHLYPTFNNLDIYFHDNPIKYSEGLASGLYWDWLLKIDIMLYDCIYQTSLIHEFTHIMGDFILSDSDTNHDNSMLFGPDGVEKITQFKIINSRFCKQISPGE